MEQPELSPQELFLERTGFEWPESSAERGGLYAYHLAPALPLTSKNIISHIDRVLELVVIESNITQKENLLGSLEIAVNTYQTKQAPIDGPLYKVGPVYQKLLEAMVDNRFSDCRDTIVKAGLVWAYKERNITPPKITYPSFEAAACPIKDFFDGAVEYYRCQYANDRRDPRFFLFPLSLMNRVLLHHQHLVSENFLEMCEDFASTRGILKRDALEALKKAENYLNRRNRPQGPHTPFHTPDGPG